MTCARCEHWTLKTSPERAVRGEGHCIGFLESLMDFTNWDAPRCGLYRQAKQMAPREKWISARIAANAAAGSNTNAAPGLPEGSPVNELGRLATSPCAHQK